MEKTFVNIFNGVKDMDTSKKISVLDVIWKITEGEWENQISTYRLEPDKQIKEELKKELPAITFAGTLSGARRNDANIEKYTNIIVCDIDKITSGKLKTYKNILKLDNYVLAYFESPSKGLKVLIKVDSELKHHSSHAFAQIEQYMKEHYEIVIDPSGKNYSRLCFISHDPDTHYNEDYDVFPVDISIDYEKLEMESNSNFSRIMNDKFEVSNDSKYVFDKCCEWIKNSATGGYRKYNRNKFVFALSCRLSEAGVDMGATIALVNGRYGSLGFKEIKSTVNSAYKITRGKFGSKPVRQRKSNQSKLF